MTLKYNQSGHCSATNEYELYSILDNITLGYINRKKQYLFDIGCIIDYYGLDPKTQLPVLIEVKNWFLKIKDMEQLIKYLIHATEKYGENNFHLKVIVGGIENSRKKILDKLGIEVYLTKDLVK